MQGNHDLRAGIPVTGKSEHTPETDAPEEKNK
jgi:hypothetical protein